MIGAKLVGGQESQRRFLNEHSYLLMDRDTKFCSSFMRLLESAGIKCLCLPKRSPNLNAHLERFLRSIKEECLGRLVLFGESSLRNAVCEYLEHYHGERNHQGLANQLLVPFADDRRVEGELQQRERLGGMLRYYYRDAA